jgi:hypothetical protein
MAQAQGRFKARGVPTSPWRGEVAAKRREGVTVSLHSITPPRCFAPTLPLQGEGEPRRLGGPKNE